MLINSVWDSATGDPLPDTTTLRAIIYGARHGFTGSGNSLDETGSRQMAATRDTHLAGVRFHGVYSSELPRAIESGVILGTGSTPEVQEADPDLGYKWTQMDAALVRYAVGRPEPRDVRELLARYPPAVACRVVIRRRIQLLLERLFNLDGPAEMLRPDLVRHLLIVSHRYAMETIVENDEGFPLLENGDIFRMEATATLPQKPPWKVQFYFGPATYLRCPIPSPC